MRGYRLTEVYRIDGHLVVADSIEDAVRLYRKYVDNKFISIDSVELIYGDYCKTNSAAIIEDKND